MNTFIYGLNNPLLYIDPEGLASLAGDANPSMMLPLPLSLATLEGAKRGVTLDEDVRRSALTRDGILPTVGIAGSANALGLAGTTVPVDSTTAAACYKSAEKLKDPCKNTLLAAVLGAGICGQATGTVKGSARSYPRDRERIEDVGNASTRAPRKNTGTIPE